MLPVDGDLPATTAQCYPGWGHCSDLDPWDLPSAPVVAAHGRLAGTAAPRPGSSSSSGAHLRRLRSGSQTSSDSLARPMHRARCADNGAPALPQPIYETKGRTPAFDPADPGRRG